MGSSEARKPGVAEGISRKYSTRHRLSACAGSGEGFAAVQQYLPVDERDLSQHVEQKVDESSWAAVMALCCQGAS